jgi:hypothetical protein
MKGHNKHDGLMMVKSNLTFKTHLMFLKTWLQSQRGQYKSIGQDIDTGYQWLRKQSHKMSSKNSINMSQINKSILLTNKF